jgi:hypothetical protein
MKIRTDKTLREIGVEILAQGSIVLALEPHLRDAATSGDAELHKLLALEIEKAQIRIRKLAALVPISRKHLTKHLLGFSNGVKMVGRPRRKKSA